MYVYVDSNEEVTGELGRIGKRWFRMKAEIYIRLGWFWPHDFLFYQYIIYDFLHDSSH